jgi:hypothetical protein
MAEASPQYYFRGTTIGWAGNQTNRTLGVVCTTSNPVKAILFALCCGGFREEQVVYVAKEENITAKYTSNVFEVIEDEKAFELTHKKFYSACDGYVCLEDMLMIARDIGIRIELPIDNGNLNQHLKKVASLTEEEIDFFLNVIKNKIKKH